MDDFDRRPPVDPLAMAEAVGAGRLSVQAAEAALRSAVDPRRADAAIAEFHDLVAAVRGVRRHSEALRVATGSGQAPAGQPALPLGASATEGSAPATRLGPTDIRVRRRTEPRSSRWAAAGALLAAVLVIAVGAAVVPGLLSKRVAATPTPSASTVSASPTPVSTSAAPGIPGVPSTPLPDAPDAFFWTSASDGSIVVSHVRPGGDLGVLCSVRGFPDPASSLDSISRTLLVSPNGSAFVLAESLTGSQSKSRLRLFSIDGTQRYESDDLGTWTITWAPDGKRVAIGITPGPWTVLSAQPDGSWSAKSYDLPGDQPYGLLAFSANGRYVYGYATQGEADFWDGPPLRVDLSTGATKPLAAFPTGDAAIGQSNVTTLADLVEPTTGRIVDPGGPQGLGWEVRDGSRRARLLIKPVMSAEGPGVAWGPASYLALDATGDPSANGFTLATASLTGTTLSPEQTVFAMDRGTYTARLVGVRDGFALVAVVASDRAQRQTGFDEAIVVRLSDGASSVLVPRAPAVLADGLHTGGWLSAPGG
ncbi:MAG: hypothetical protein E6G67_11620 [Actinobacteria bacterium]|nr:MAG: hypothetical protein E6G67_11620 [Actinomycetota bacterium]